MSFAIGDAVRTRGAPASSGHTRVPAYLRARAGRIVAICGAFPLPDLRARGAQATPETLYTVRFEARDVWAGSPEGEAETTLYADLWESYLERV